MKVKRDHYLVMGLTPLCKEADIKKRYKDLIKKYHPDLNPNNREYAEARMKEITEAYNVLSNRVLRKKYDESPYFKPLVPIYLKRLHSVKEDILKSKLKKEGLWERIKNIFFPKKREKDEPLSEKGMEHFSMGVTYLTHRDEVTLKLAKEEFLAVLKESPNNPEALFNIGLVEYKLGNFQEAREYFKRAKENLKNNTKAIYLLEMLREE